MVAKHDKNECAQAAAATKVCVLKIVQLCLSAIDENCMYSFVEIKVVSNQKELLYSYFGSRQ